MNDDLTRRVDALVDKLKPHAESPELLAQALRAEVASFQLELADADLAQASAQEVGFLLQARTLQIINDLEQAIKAHG